MGNLLGSPITEKDTHVGTTVDSNADHSSSSDGGGLQYGISSMQGWRVHMEDAHIAQPFLYAERLKTSEDDTAAGGNDNDNGGSKDKQTDAIEATLSGEENEDGSGSMASSTEVNVTTTSTATSSSSTSNKVYTQIPLPNHALFACFDGHGGKFAAEYASGNLLRVLCRSELFCQYAEKWRGRDVYLDGVRDKLKLLDVNKEDSSSATTPPPASAESDDKKRLQQLKKRGHDSDEKVRQIKERVRKHMDGEEEDAAMDATSAASSSAPSSNSVDENTEFQYAQATYDHELMTLLEHSLRDAFIDLDTEILREVRGDKVPDANSPYGAGYDLSMHTLQGCVGHMPKEADGGSDANDTTNNNNHPVPLDDEDAGTTAVVVLTTPKWIVCANAGDSRSVYSRSTHRTVPLSYDHKPEDDDEERRIREAGGYVSGGRVEGDLAVSRGLGDYRFKDLDAVMSGSRGESVRRTTSIMQRQIVAQEGDAAAAVEEDVPMLRPSEQKVSPVPDIIVQNRDPKEDEFIVIACDGIWDVQTNQECVRMVADIFAEGECDLGLVCEEILDLCLIKGSKDNMTAAVIKFPKQIITKGGGVMARRERRGMAASANDGNGGQLRRADNPYVPPGMGGEGEGQDQQQEE